MPNSKLISPQSIVSDVERVFNNQIAFIKENVKGKGVMKKKSNKLKNIVRSGMNGKRKRGVFLTKTVQKEDLASIRNAGKKKGKARKINVRKSSKARKNNRGASKPPRRSNNKLTPNKTQPRQTSRRVPFQPIVLSNNTAAMPMAPSCSRCPRTSTKQRENIVEANER